MLTLNDIRAGFVEYFQNNNHLSVPSGPLVPFNDPTLLFTNSGMVQFKDVFTGRQPRPAPCAVTVQKCVRAGGKHNDLDNVGHTARHHTFFEMMGNFSFGDYFKEQAIPLAWNLVVGEFGLPKDRLMFTVYAEDEEAASLWKKVSGCGDERIVRIPTSDNFWSMGPTGPCGPCSEIFYDHGEAIPGGPPGTPEEDGDRFVEIWNLVFMQFEQFADGSREPLARPSIDTGMGLERIGAVLQGTHDNYDTDLFRALIEASAEVFGHEPEGEGRVHHRVIADHLRAACFLIADGVLPSNAGRGYVLRRILRRAMRHAHQLGTDEPLMWRLVPTLVRNMGQAFPELDECRELAVETLRFEESQFRSTLSRGLGLLEVELGKLGMNEPLSGQVAFRLFDTYGFPIDLTEDALREQGRRVDLGGFEAAMAEQRARSRASRLDSGTGDELASLWLAINEEFPPTEFLGYSTGVAQGEILAVIQGGARTEAGRVGENVAIVANQTPFYAEAGGQVSDTGVIRCGDGSAEVTNTYRRGGLIVHEAEVTEGAVAIGDAAEFIVDVERRTRIRSNHTATHLLHEALRIFLGSHIEQRGSLVAPGRLRFDFLQPKPVAESTISEVETEVNERIRENCAVATKIMKTDEAMALGARALFGEKYGDEVRVVSMGACAGGQAYSVELCGGTHVERTGDIGVFKIVGEEAVAAGIRRVEALTGQAAFSHLAMHDRALRATASMLRVPPGEVEKRIERLMEERRRLADELGDLRKRIASGEALEQSEQPREIAGIRFLGKRVENVVARDLRGIVDTYKQKIGSGVIAVVADVNGKAAAAVGVTGDLSDRISAVELVQEAASALGGKGGGGRADLAQAGGPNVANLGQALAAVERKILENRSVRDSAV